MIKYFHDYNDNFIEISKSVNDVLCPMKWWTRLAYLYAIFVAIQSS